MNMIDEVNNYYYHLIDLYIYLFTYFDFEIVMFNQKKVEIFNLSSILIYFFSCHYYFHVIIIFNFYNHCLK